MDSPLLAHLDAANRMATISTQTSPRPDLPEIDGLLAGAAEVDITPPPGMPKAGHSKNAQDGNGFRTRLKARVIHLRSGRTSIALIAGDMHGGSAIVHRLLGAAVESSSDIPLSGIFLGATHTHAGPGQYHGCDFYNRWASNRAGFDPAYTQFLVDQLSAAVVAAYATRRPAKMASGVTEVWGCTRNRSLMAHVVNDTVGDKRLEPQRKYASINPSLHVIRVDGAESSGGFAPLGALAVFSIHGTGISRHDPSYNADVWAYITGEFARRVEATTGRRAVIAAVEGSHGDMTPAVREGMLVFPEAERLGRDIGEAAAALHDRLESSLSAGVDLAAGYREIDLAARPSIGGIVLPDPAVGTAKLAGATENNSPVVNRIPPFKAGYPKPDFLARRSQGAKWVFAGSALQRRVNPVGTFPRVLPLQLLRLGHIALLALPFEVTVEAGRRLEQTIAAALGGPTAGIDRVAVSSVANDYWDYLTTPEEYRRQCYEGASTLYGPKSHAFVTAATADLARRLARDGGVEDFLAERHFRFHLHRYFPKPSGSTPPRRSRRQPLGTPKFVEATSHEDAFWDFQWLDSPPGDITWNRPMVRVEGLVGGVWRTTLDRDNVTVDDDGWRLGVTHLGEAGGAHRYSARWYGPPVGQPGYHRFVLLEGDGQPQLTGSAFD